MTIEDVERLLLPTVPDEDVTAEEADIAYQSLSGGVTLRPPGSTYLDIGVPIRGRATVPVVTFGPNGAARHEMTTANACWLLATVPPGWIYCR